MSLQVSLEISGGVFCLICIAMLTVMRGYDKGRAQWLIALFSACGAWFFISALAGTFEGSDTTAAYYIVRISFFFAWLLDFTCIALMAFYVRELIRGAISSLADNRDSSLLRDRIGYGVYISLGICALGAFLLILSQVFDIFYYFDTDNIYRRLMPAFVMELIPAASATYFFILIIPFFRHLRSGSVFCVVYSYVAVMIAMLLNVFYKEIPFSLFLTLTSGIVFFMGCITDCLRDVKIKEETIARKDAAITEQRARIMQSQIRPHFIFNSLLAIKQLCLEEPRKAAEALQHFSTFLRANLESLTDEKPVPISREIECIKEYVALEQADPSGRFSVNYDIGFEDFKVPLLSVEPMVENAIRHGVASKKSGGIVTIRTFKEGDKAVVTVEDNGSGFGSETAQQARHRSIGIQNVRDRLSLICDGELSIVNTGNGTIVRITVPCEPGGDIE